jgi:VanZ family protein
MDILYKFTFFITLAAIEFLATTSRHIALVANIWDKAKHSFAFFVLYILLSLAFKDLTTKEKTFLLLLYGIQIEIVQYFIPTRDFSLLDIVADLVGIAIGVVVYKLIKR